MTLISQLQTSSIARMLSLYKLTGICNDIEEVIFVHNILAPLLDYTFSVDVNLQYSWANVCIDSEYKEYKPDYMLYANGLSKKFIVLVAEFKPPKAYQRFEFDYIKLGKEMRLLINRLYGLGVEKPVVCGILVLKDIVHTFKMELKDAKVYAMIQLSKTLLCKSSEDLYKVLTLASVLN
ncbi:hypothetical protein INT45_008237 [Circinella minor]|uniref:Uncharacterized protein n=1 Tax=Circinella minor TaxID=1195481 RepID=A0A8H7S7L5_9FUNG|nr:hypothetical protein INT45_008237 [Circinella minor]